MKRVALSFIAAFFVLHSLAFAAVVDMSSEPSHHLALENEYVRVFKVEVAPKASTLMHWHGHDYVFVTLGASQVSNAVINKAPITLNLQDGETRFVDGNFAHVATNLSDKPFRNVTIEFLKDEAAHKTPPPKWDEERGLQILNGGTRDILFVKDGVRVSDVQLQAGAMIPKHHHNGPHLVVALTDVDLRSEVEGAGTFTKIMKAGDVAWIPGNLTHSVMNMGKETARLITVEFQ